MNPKVLHLCWEKAKLCTVVIFSHIHQRTKVSWALVQPGKPVHNVALCTTATGSDLQTAIISRQSLVSDSIAEDFPSSNNLQTPESVRHT